MKQTIQTYSGLSDMMTRFFDRCSDPVVISSTDSRILYTNMIAAKLARVRSPKDLIEKYYKEVNSPLFENEFVTEKWQHQDQRIANKQVEELKMLEIHPRATACPYIIKKMPLYNENKEISGVVNYMKYLEIFRPNDFIMGRLPGSLLLNRPDDFFTERECEIIFLKLQRMTNKTIARILNRAPRTIDNMMQRMYQKAEVNNATDFEEFCEKRELHLYLPARFIDAQHFKFGYGCGSTEL